MPNFKESKLRPISKVKDMDEADAKHWFLDTPHKIPDEQQMNIERNIIYIVDPDEKLGLTITSMLVPLDCDVEHFSDCTSFLAYYRPGRFGCLIVDAHQVAEHGLDLIGSLKDDGQYLPTIVMSDDPSSAMIVQAMRAGAFDFMEKQALLGHLVTSIRLAIAEQARIARAASDRTQTIARLATLTSREKEIMELVLAGYPSKNIAADLGISQRTVENHRASISRKLETRNLSALIHKVLSTRSEQHAAPPVTPTP